MYFQVLTELSVGYGSDPISHIVPFWLDVFSIRHTCLWYTFFLVLFPRGSFVSRLLTNSTAYVL
ncbi:hypothetical protein M752DRAFT_80579 [Aspergillus phoenicis ATCC 13157]|uniref:Uncharacterized protein n=1 Tax=Aspergillus phoenicis ATCC 13157 TaxID=1353007 RepID=A0A370P7T1_ASPPH|nr:hypothetical protein M752DRAFT_80579 [Aspergillus phoenicis ATCC 13157]